ncbi:biotin-independent malonate decarboxylase subunit beta [Metabacillus sediminilitoris]|uniref:Biotin-independent malonate decarboxylase subunit beta n=1 Tax=Metabacillus sediminilitoris TaxID=2567941 RepID=A0A4S4BX12_9BACI|nr:biotin-independent malonate decarboxylase subunit beta [Metabacillus sediminilitoris]QGQ45499.1 biotin-independent malonate decarboxylase subunit beta [Metabacillus sediminilitoris]THF77644.1 biotin-independent malonate decarboxylase subunit beta [Metabacillus sediminilitoris]
MIRTCKASFVECSGRERAQNLLDYDTFKELLGPWDHLESPHLEPQGIVPQSDDGVIIAKGTINKHPAVVISIEGKFQGGGIGEVSGAKIAGILEKALKDCETGIKTIPVFVFDTGGVRLQEANYGLLAIAEISAAIVALRRYVPVIAVIPGKIGAFGGMSITAGLCSAIIMTREGRLGLNGPEVIEQEAGIREFDSKDRPLIWSTIGGEQRKAAGFADVLIEDDTESIKEVISSIIKDNIIPVPRTEQVRRYEAFLDLVNPEQRLSSDDARLLWAQSENEVVEAKQVNLEGINNMGRGHTWFDLLRGDAMEIGDLSSVRVADGVIGEKKVRFIAVVPDVNNRFPRARKGEVGLQEGWSIAKYIREAIKEDQNSEKRAIVAIVDVPSQAYGYHEELLGIHQACAAAVDAYASARLSGHPVISFIPGNAISGAFLAHGLQANRLIALRDAGVNVHVMSKESAARITQRSLEELEFATKKVPAMAYDIESFEKLGALFSLVDGIEADIPGKKDLDIIYKELERAIKDVCMARSKDLHERLTSSFAQSGRKASILVREKLSEQWN